MRRRAGAPGIHPGTVRGAPSRSQPVLNHAAAALVCGLPRADHGAAGVCLHPNHPGRQHHHRGDHLGRRGAGRPADRRRGLPGRGPLSGLRALLGAAGHGWRGELGRRDAVRHQLFHPAVDQSAGKQRVAARGACVQAPGGRRRAALARTSATGTARSECSSRRVIRATRAIRRRIWRTSCLRASTRPLQLSAYTSIEARARRCCRPSAVRG